MSQQRRNRRMALKLLPIVMELDSDVAIPGKQRHISERQSLDFPSPNAREPRARSATELRRPQPTPKKAISPFIQDSDDSDDNNIPNLSITPPTSSTLHSSEVTLHVQEVNHTHSFPSTW